MRALQHAADMPRTKTLLTEEDEALAREVALETLADVRTVRREIRGEQVRGVIGAVIRSAIKRRANQGASAKRNVASMSDGAEWPGRDSAQARLLLLDVVRKLAAGEYPRDAVELRAWLRATLRMLAYELTGDPSYDIDLVSQLCRGLLNTLDFGERRAC